MKHEKGDYLVDIGNLYGGVLDKIVAENAAANAEAVTIVTEAAKGKFPGKGTFEMAGKDKKKKNPFADKKSGPAAAEGVRKPAKADAKFSMSSEKTQTVGINNHMSKNFDKLVSDVLNDRLQLEAPEMDAIDTITAEPETGEPAVGDDAGGLPGEEGVDDATAEFEGMSCAEIIEHLRTGLEVLAGKCGGDDELDADVGAGDEAGGMPEDLTGEPEGGEIAGEATSLEALPDSAGQKLQGAKKSNAVNSSVKAVKSKVTAKVTDEVGTEETGVHPLVSPEKMSKGLNGKNNKVAGATAGKVGYQIGH